MLIIGEAERFECGKQIAAYLGLVPEEDPSGESRRLGPISKPGSGWMRFFLVEAAPVTVRSDAEWRNRFFHLAMRPWTEDREGGDGAPISGSLVLDVAQPVGLRAAEKVRSARGPARNRRWCAVEHRVNRLGSPLPFTGEFELAIMIEVVVRRDAWVGLGF